MLANIEQAPSRRRVISMCFLNTFARRIISNILHAYKKLLPLSGYKFLTDVTRITTYEANLSCSTCHARYCIMPTSIENKNAPARPRRLAWEACRRHSHYGECTMLIQKLDAKRSIALMHLSRCISDIRCRPMPHYKIASQKSFPPADNLPAKMLPARRPPGRGRFLPVNCQPRETFLADDPIMGRLWQYFSKGKTYQFRD